MVRIHEHSRIRGALATATDCGVWLKNICAQILVNMRAYIILYAICKWAIKAHKQNYEYVWFAVENLVHRILFLIVQPGKRYVFCIFLCSIQNHVLNVIYIEYWLDRFAYWSYIKLCVQDYWCFPETGQNIVINWFYIRQHISHYICCDIKSCSKSS